MTKRLTPAEAWEHVKALTHRDVVIRKSCVHDGYTEVLMNGTYVFHALFDIDWGKFKQWPPPVVEKKWRPARFPEDWDKPARFSDELEDGSPYCWQKSRLVGYNTMSSFPWICDAHDTWELCQVEDIPEQAQTPPNGDREEVVCTEKENTLKPMPIEIETHPADREPTDEEVERAGQLFKPTILSREGGPEDWVLLRAKDWLKAWQQVWREST